MARQKITKNARAVINGWLDNVREGDKIVIRTGYAIIYNDCGCENDKVYLY